MSVCDVPVIASVCDAVGEGTASLIAAPFDWLAQAMGQAAAWLFEAVWAVFDTTTLVDVTGSQYVSVYNVLFGVAIFVMLVFFCLQLITGLVHRDPMALSRAGLGLAKSVLGSFIAITLTATLLEVTDQLAIGIVQATGNTMEGIGDRMALLAAGLTTINIASPGVGAIITIFLAGLGIAGAGIVWFTLLIRKALLLVAIVFAPIALAGFTWDAAKGWFGRWAAFVVALIFSKLVIVVVFLVAIGQISAPIDLDLASISDPISGVVLMFIAAFAPYLTYKFISFVGFDMYHAMSSEQEAKSALNRPIPMPVKAQPSGAKPVLDGQGGSGGSAPPTSSTAPAAGGDAAAAGAGGGVAASGGGTAASGGAAAAAGPAAAAVIGAQVAKAAATSGPKAGAALGGAAIGQADAAEPVAAAGPTQRGPVTVPPAPRGNAAAPPTPQPRPSAPTTPRKG